MSSLSIAIATRSARARCSAEANAVRSASATTKRSETRPPATAPSGRALSPRPETRRRAPSRWPTTTRSIPACSSTPATTGPRGAAARASLLGAEILAVTSSVQTLADRRPCRLDPVLRTVTLPVQLGPRLGDARRRHAQRRGGARQSLARLAHLAQRAGPGHGLDAPHARADALLLGDEERSDVARAVTVRATAELAAIAGLDDAHLVVVLFAEERHRP